MNSHYHRAIIGGTGMGKTQARKTLVRACRKRGIPVVVISSRKDLEAFFSLLKPRPAA
ncbi:MAG: type IV secretion system DNA-binding domain-containing protein [Opitutaceae bacterium]|nr:type IV secretion system DNA-binding domain-containing protein [Opitutaceae bacterium]